MSDTQRMERLGFSGAMAGLILNATNAVTNDECSELFPSNDAICCYWYTVPMTDWNGLGLIWLDQTRVRKGRRPLPKNVGEIGSGLASL